MDPAETEPSCRDYRYIPTVNALPTPHGIQLASCVTEFCPSNPSARPSCWVEELLVERATVELLLDDRATVELLLDELDEMLELLDVVRPTVELLLDELLELSSPIRNVRPIAPLPMP